MHNPKNGAKRSVRFSDVTVYYFQRVQGFLCVPSDPGATLGMKFAHNYVEKFNLSKYDYLKDWEDECEETKIYNKLLIQRARGNETPEYHWTLNMLKNKKKPIGKGPMYPLSFRQRLHKLKSAGVENIDTKERDDINTIKDSRIICGCNCIDGCRTVCACAEAGVPCQVERTNAENSYPCNCGSTGCDNESGRIEYDLDSIKTFVRKTLERTRSESEISETPEPLHNHFEENQYGSNVILSIISDELDIDEMHKEKVYPHPEVYCSSEILQKTLTSNLIPGCETYDCGCCKIDSSRDFCPNCTCEPMDVASSPEISNEDEFIDKEQNEEHCSGCNQKPCVTITKMMTNFQQLAIISDTCDQGTMTTLWPWYEDLEEVVTGQKGPSAMLVDPFSSRKRIFEESDEVEMTLHNNDFQKCFQSFVVNSRRKVCAVFRGRSVQKVKDYVDQTKNNSDDMPALVPLPECINLNTHKKNESEFKSAKSGSISDFTVIKPLPSLKTSSNESLSGSLSSSSGDLHISASPLQSTVDIGKKACSISNLVTCDRMKSAMERCEPTLEIFDDSNIVTSSESTKFSKLCPITRSSSLERNIHSFNRFKPRYFIRSDMKYRSIENFVKNFKANNTIKRANKSESAGRRSRRSQPKQEQVQHSRGSKELILDGNSSRSNSPEPVTANSSDTSNSSKLDSMHPDHLSVANFMSDLQSLTYSFRPKISFQVPASNLKPQEQNFCSGTNVHSYTVVPTSQPSSSGVHPHLGLDPPSSFTSISSGHLDIPHGKSISTCNQGSFFKSMSEVKQPNFVFKQPKGIWGATGHIHKSKDISQLVSFFIKDIHSRISSSKSNQKGSSIEDVSHLLTGTQTKLFDISASSTVLDPPFRSI